MDSIFAQKHNCSDTINPTIDNSKYIEGIDQYSYEGDSIKKVIIIFENNFNGDQVAVLVNNRIKWKKNVTTVRTKGASNQVCEIDYAEFKEPPLITIKIKHKRCVSFYPILGKRICYINYFKEEAWSIQASNILKSYR